MKTREQYRHELDLVDRQLAVLYRERREIMEQFSGDYETVLPPPRRRTQKQMLVSICPRCSGRLQ